MTVTVNGTTTTYAAGDVVPYDATNGAKITLGGMTVNVSGTPADGDKLTIAPNASGATTDNRNGLALSALQNDKTKVGGKEGKSTVFSFHVSNGTVTPAGLDPARDLVTVGIETKTISKSGSWLEFGGQRRQGEHALVAAVAEDPDLFAALDRAVRSKLSESDAEDAEEVEEHTDD